MIQSTKFAHPGDRERPIEEELRKPRSIGELELMAGFGSAHDNRYAFWIQFKDLETSRTIPAGVAELKKTDPVI